jgi:uncharacterized damage-inducible protein DinB
MDLDSFVRNWQWVHRMTLDFVQAVPDERWEFTPDERQFGSFARQLRHVVRGRGVYNEALRTKAADWSKSGDYYSGPLTRTALLEALTDKQNEFLEILPDVDVSVPISYGKAQFTLDNFLYEMVQHESIHHGQWSVYAALGGFATPTSWQTGWKL